MPDEMVTDKNGKIRVKKIRARSQRNKIVSILSALTPIVAGVEAALPGVLPPGTSVAGTFVLGTLATLFNVFWPK